MPAPLAEVLTNYLASWRPNEKRLLFSNRRGNPYNENKVVQKRLWPILDALSIPRCGMHAFRHSHASLLVSSGASPKVAQAQLRRSDPGNHDAGLRSRYGLGAARRSGESSSDFVSRCGQVPKG
jgi:integrase